MKPTKGANPICWIHGWGMPPSRVWHEAERYIPEAQHVYADWTGDCSSEQMLDSILQTLNQSPADGWTIVGWSMGGMLALEAAAAAAADQASIQIERIVLVNSTLRFVHPDRTKGWPLRIVKRMKEQLAVQPQQVLQSFAARMFSPEEASQEEVQAWLDDDEASRQHINPSAVEALQAGLDYLLERDVTSSWTEAVIQRPSDRLLWIHGEQDTVCPTGALPDRGQYLYQQHLLSCGHAPMLTIPRQFYPLVRSFHCNENQQGDRTKSF